MHVRETNAAMSKNKFKIDWTTIRQGLQIVLLETKT